MIKKKKNNQEAGRNNNNISQFCTYSHFKKSYLSISKIRLYLYRANYIEKKVKKEYYKPYSNIIL